MTLVPDASRGRSPNAGFSLIELVVVVGIIGLLAAVAGPPISNYLKTYKIRGAVQLFSGELQTARNKAINKNATLGVVVLFPSATTFRWVIEDDQNPTDGYRGIRPPMSSLVTESSQVGNLQTLPAGVTFVVNGANSEGLRFNGLGAACLPVGTGSCPALDTGVKVVSPLSGTDYRIKICQVQTSLCRTVLVGLGGRIGQTPDWETP